MAGFDFDVLAGANERAFFKHLLRLAQLQARRFGGEIKYRWKDRVGYSVKVDGPLQAIESLARSLGASIQSLAEGTPHESFNLRKRIQMGVRITSGYTDNLAEITDLVREVSTDFGGAPNSYTFPLIGNPALDSMLVCLTGILADYHSGLREPRVVAEEIHTVIENLMYLVLGKKSNNLSFAQKAQMCVDISYMPPPLLPRILDQKI